MLGRNPGLAVGRYLKEKTNCFVRQKENFNLLQIKGDGLFV